jgi:hypothetical protein
MATALLKLSGLAVAPRYADVARENLGAVQDYLKQAPLGFGQWLVAFDYALSRRAKSPARSRSSARRATRRHGPCWGPRLRASARTRWWPMGRLG